MTVADRLAAALLLLAALFAVWAIARHGTFGPAVLALGVTCAVATHHAISWTRSRRRPPLRLERLTDGRLQARRGAGPPLPVTIGAQTRFLGPSIFLDLTIATGGNRERCRCWLTPLDAPAQVLRRWTVLLPSAVLPTT